MLTLHGPGSESTVDAIIEKKLSCGEFKEHPDLPDNQDATLFYVLIDLDRIDEDEREDITSVSWRASMDGSTQAGSTMVGVAPCSVYNFIYTYYLCIAQKEKKNVKLHAGGHQQHAGGRQKSQPFISPSISVVGGRRNLQRPVDEQSEHQYL